MVGNPINLGVRNKVEEVPSHDTGPLGFSWFYNSMLANSFMSEQGWTRTYGMKLYRSDLIAVLQFDDGRTVQFEQNGTSWAPQGDAKYSLTENINVSYTFVDDVDRTTIFDIAGRIVSTTDRTGYAKLMQYDTNGRLVQVVDSFGRRLDLQYGATGGSTIRLIGVISNDGQQTTFDYDALGRLNRVGYPGGGVRQYFYDELAQFPDNPFALTNRLTGIVDESGRRFASFGYDATGTAISSVHAGGVGLYTINGVTTTDPLGTQRKYSFQPILGVMRTTGVSESCSICGGAQSNFTTYDTNGNVASKTDFNGNRTNFAYDLARNLETSRTEALTSTGATTAQTRTTTTVWNGTYRLPTKITESVTGGSRVTDFTYDTAGNVLTRKVTAPKNDGSGITEARTWTYTYNALGQVLTAKDPLNKTTTTVYYAATDTAVPPLFTKGDVQTITNAVGHVVTMNQYDKNGRLLRMTDANGLITAMTYHPRGWLTSRAVNNGATTETTSYIYDNVGQLTRVTMPDASTLFYAYDAAHRLVGMSDQATGASVAGNGALIITPANLAGNKIIYTLDNMGNRIKEQHFDPSGTLAKQKQRAIDALNRVQKDIGGTNYAASGQADDFATTQYAYDANGNMNLNLIFPRFNGHFYDVDKGVRDERREEEV
jgi:YD repeat-containing protein